MLNEFDDNCVIVNNYTYIYIAYSDFFTYTSYVAIDVTLV